MELTAISVLVTYRARQCSYFTIFRTNCDFLDLLTKTHFAVIPNGSTAGEFEDTSGQTKVIKGPSLLSSGEVGSQVKMEKSCQSEMFCAYCRNNPLFLTPLSLHPIRTQTIISAARKTQKYVTEHQMTLNLYVICHIGVDYVIIQLSYKVQRTSKISKMLQQPVRKQGEPFFFPLSSQKHDFKQEGFLPPRLRTLRIHYRR